MLRVTTLQNHERMSTQDLLLAIEAAVEKGETNFYIEASGQHDIGGPLWNKDGKKLTFTVNNPGQRVGSMCLPDTEVLVEGSAPADVGWLNAGGRITVRGDAGDTAAHCAAAGVVYIGGRAGTRSGSLMKHDPVYSAPELWVLKSVGSFSFEFMGGGKAVVGADLAAHIGRGIVKGIAQTHVVKGHGQFFRKLIGNALMHIQPLGAVAHLTAEDGARSCDCPDGQIQISVLAHNGRSLAAQFQRNLGNIFRAGGDNALPGLNTAGKRNHVRLRAGRQGFAHAAAAARDDVEHACRQIHLLGHQPGKFHRCGRGHAAGLDDGRAAHQKGWGNLAGHDKEGEVPGADAHNHADGLAIQQDVFTRAVALDDLPFIDARPTGVIVKVVCRKIHLHLRQRVGLGLLLSQDAAQILTVSADDGGKFFQIFRAGRRGQGSPAALRPGGGLQGGHGVLAPAIGSMGHYFSG